MVLARDKMTHIGNQVEDSFKNSFNQQFGDFDQHLGAFQQNFNQQFGHFGNNLDNFGNGLLSQFDRSFGWRTLNFEYNLISTFLFSRNFHDVFGVFGRRQTPWWQLGK